MRTCGAFLAEMTLAVENHLPTRGSSLQTFDLPSDKLDNCSGIRYVKNFIDNPLKLG